MNVLDADRIIRMACKLKVTGRGMRWSVNGHQKEYMIGPPNYLYGGISASLIDCHSVNTALSYAHRKTGNDKKYDRSIQMVTGSMNLRYVKPVPMSEVELRATVEKVDGRKYFY